MKTDLATLENEVATLLVGLALRAKAADAGRLPPSIGTAARSEIARSEIARSEIARSEIDGLFAVLWGVLFDAGSVTLTENKAYDLAAESICGRVLQETGCDICAFV